MLVTIWLVTSLVLSLRLAGGWLCLQFFSRWGTAAAGRIWREGLVRASRLVPLRRTVRLFESGWARAPVAVGWLRPVILVPAGLLTGLTPQQVEALLMHELIHIRRYEYLINLLQSVAETLLFYHPATWWISHQVRTEREYLCDDLTVALCGDSVGYARALATVEEQRSLVYSLGMAASSHPLLTRIARLVGPGAARDYRVRARFPALVALPTLLALILGLLTYGILSVPPASASRDATASHPEDAIIEVPVDELPDPARTPDVVWDRDFGGPELDQVRSIQRTLDGGYVATGAARPYGAAATDAWLTKTSVDGSREWDRSFGGPDDDSAASVRQTRDGGYIVGAFTNSFGAGDFDWWLIKTDADGNREWDETYGGSGGEAVRSVQQTSDGGYIGAGYTRSFGAGYYDYWLVKTDSRGRLEWDRTFGTSRGEYAHAVQQTSDGGYAVAGATQAGGSNLYPIFDAWLIKTDPNGAREWDVVLGGAGQDYINAVEQTADGGFVLAGLTEWTGSDNSRLWTPDFWLAKVDARGSLEWDRTFGGPEDEVAFAVLQNSDGGYSVMGCAGSRGEADCSLWMVQTDQHGNKQSERLCGTLCRDWRCSSQLELAPGLRTALLSH